MVKTTKTIENGQRRQKTKFWYNISRKLRMAKTTKNIKNDQNHKVQH